MEWPTPGQWIIRICQNFHSFAPLIKDICYSGKLTEGLEKVSTGPQSHIVNKCQPPEEDGKRVGQTDGNQYILYHKQDHPTRE